MKSPLLEGKSNFPRLGVNPEACYNESVSLERKSLQHQQLLQTLESRCHNLPLCQVSTDIVLGHGNLNADVMFIGEAPGQKEAELRLPFIGRSGQLLNAALEQVGLSREDMYVTSIVKVRPPANRDPKPDEIAAYTPYLEDEIEIVQPKLICTLGRFSMNYFLPEAKISQVHGQLHTMQWRDRTLHVLPQFHPAAAMRSTRVKNDFIADLHKITEVLHTMK